MFDFELRKRFRTEFSFGHKAFVIFHRKFRNILYNCKIFFQLFCKILHLQERNFEKIGKSFVLGEIFK
jgi:hypothetical protein